MLGAVRERLPLNGFVIVQVMMEQDNPWKPCRNWAFTPTLVGTSEHGGFDAHKFN